MRRYFRAIKNRFIYIFEVCRNQYTILFMTAPKVLSTNDTIDFILKNKCSVSRNGDGEIFLMTGRSIDFQQYDSRLAGLMKLALSEQNARYLPCVINVFNNADYKKGKHKSYYVNHLRTYRYYWYKYTNSKCIYGNASITRFYSSPKDSDNAKRKVEKLRKIWHKRDLLIVEGEKSRLGIGNDLFNNAGKISRILVPSENAFSKYDEIKNEIKKVATTDSLIFLAIGPTATALAYELYKDGYWAIDIGHIDICYEWYIRGVERGYNIPGKYTNESNGNKLEGELPDEDMKIYKSQIVKIIV